MESAHESELVPHRNCSSRLVTDAGRRSVLRPAHSAVHVDRIARLIRSATDEDRRINFVARDFRSPGRFSSSNFSYPIGLESRHASLSDSAVLFELGVCDACGGSGGRWLGRRWREFFQQ